MWKMFDDMIDCNECGNQLEPPPKFLIPPPPRPPALFDLVVNGNCNEAESAEKIWDKDICDVIAIQDISMQNRQSLQATVFICVFSLLLILVVLIASLIVWKNKQKFYFFSADKTPPQVSHLSGMLHIHGSSCEDSNADINNHRTFIVQPLNINVILNGENNHYSSGFPMMQSPTYSLPSSPGPDPYRSHDNVYAELEYERDSDAESQPSINSDADLAEDEFSLSQENAENVASIQLPTNDQGNCMQLYYVQKDTLCNSSTTHKNQQYTSDCRMNSLQFDNRANFQLRSLAATPSAVSSISENQVQCANEHCLHPYRTVNAQHKQMNWSSSLNSKRSKSNHRILKPPTSYAEMVLKGKTSHENYTTPLFQTHLAYTSLQTTNNENYQNISPIYASSIGSDSGYSHHTATSSIDRNDYVFPLPKPATPPFQKVNKMSLSKPLGFNWSRKVGTSSCQYTFNCPKNMRVLPVSSTTSTCNNVGKVTDGFNNDTTCQHIHNSDKIRPTGFSLNREKQTNRNHYKYPFSRR